MTDRLAQEGGGAVPSAVSALAGGRPVIVVDDGAPDNRGDLLTAAEHVDVERMRLLLDLGRANIFVAMPAARAAELHLRPAWPATADSARMPVSGSIDLVDGAAVVGPPGFAGLSTEERTATVRRIADPSARPGDFRHPGSVTVLIAREGGVLERAAHTEAAVDLVRLAGLGGSAAMTPLMGADGSPMRLPDIERVAADHEIPVVTVTALAAHRRRAEPGLERGEHTRLTTRFGTFDLIEFRDRWTGLDHYALVKGKPAGRRDVLVRVHSECLTGDALGSRRCDCGAQLARSLHAIDTRGTGVFVYLRGHEGRGIGLLAKLEAYRLQDMGLDTVDANHALGLKADSRDYSAGGEILDSLGVSSIQLLTNNPRKVTALEQRGIAVRRVPLHTGVTPENARYLATKRDRLGHQLPAGSDL
jgi:3,4-dihydroxy 2-butanone 4-phosphate synthase/GTP cyclohydrolase II